MLGKTDGRQTLFCRAEPAALKLSNLNRIKRREKLKLELLHFSATKAYFNCLRPKNEEIDQFQMF